MSETKNNLFANNLNTLAPDKFLPSERVRERQSLQKLLNDEFARYLSDLSNPKIQERLKNIGMKQPNHEDVLLQVLNDLLSKTHVKLASGDEFLPHPYDLVGALIEFGQDTSSAPTQDTQELNHLLSNESLKRVLIAHVLQTSAITLQTQTNLGRFSQTINDQAIKNYEAGVTKDRELADKVLQLASPSPFVGAAAA